ncbi:MAG: WD40 repeat domain-containing protein [Deltaproteobacteria bacterium]|nr:WD40 repeat domain-containing protein [Deltaproteobacteria bacterium]
MSLTIETRGLVHTVQAPPFCVNSEADSVAVSPDGALLLVAGDKMLEVLDRVSGELLQRIALRGAGGYGQSAIFTGDSASIVSGGHTGSVQVFDARTGAEKRTIETGFRNTIALAASPSAPWLLFTGGFDQHARLWDLRDGRVVAELPFWEHIHDARSYVHGAVFSPDGSRLVTLTYQGASLWDAHTHEHLGVVADENFVPAGAAFGPDGEDLFLANNKGRFCLVNPRTLQVELDREVLPLGRSTHGLGVTADAKWLVAASEDGCVHVLSPRTLVLKSSSETTAGIPQMALCTQDPTHAWVNARRGRIERVRVPSAEIVATVGGGTVQSLTFDDAANVLVIAREAHGVERVDLVTTACSVLISADGLTGAVSPGGDYAMAYVPKTGALVRWDLRTGQALEGVVEGYGSMARIAIDRAGGPIFAMNNAVRAAGERWTVSGLTPRAGLSQSRSGAWIALIDRKGLWRIHVRDRVIETIAERASGELVAISETGEVAYVAGSKITWAGSVDELTGQRPGVSSAAIAKLSSLAISQDGSCCAAGDSEGSLYLVRRDQPKRVASARALLGRVTAVAFSADGRRVAVSGTDPEVRVYDVDTLMQVPEKTSRKPAKKSAKSP